MSDQQRELLANIAPFGLRMQPELKEKIKQAAEDNGRSMNAEIVQRLEDSFEFADLKYVLEFVASTNGRRVGEEVAFRLRQSFEAEEQDQDPKIRAEKAALSGDLKALAKEIGDLRYEFDTYVEDTYGHLGRIIRDAVREALDQAGSGK
ncbi:Arc family DNA-binding protein [Martelella alba]|uniref:Arc family DNA-binding protein n=1 Tax=Martelella alba TaxID=2590451 RepID=A0A506U2U0_9HYPH|nr:Arc family DNA-binding protein [Martelella alba]TPW27798.1 Arc family DNA-binding protein [Martelella alba]